MFICEQKILYDKRTVNLHICLIIVNYIVIVIFNTIIAYCKFS